MQSEIGQKSTLYLIRNVWSHLRRRRQIQFIFLLSLMFLSAIAEIASLGTVLPFVGALISPEKLFEYKIVKILSQILSLHTPKQLVLTITIMFILIAITSGIIRLLQLWVGSKLACVCGTELSTEIYRKTLHQPYLVHLSRNSSKVISGLTNKVDVVVSGVLTPSLTIISSGIMLFGIVITLILINPTVAITAVIGFGLIYGVISVISRNKLLINSKLIAREHSIAVKTIQEGIGGIRDVLLDGIQSIYSEVYYRADQKYRKAQSNNVFIAGSPRFITESIGMSLIATIAFSLTQQDGGAYAGLPVLGALALGAQRILPSLQNIYSSWSSIKGTNSSLVEVVELLEQPEASQISLQSSESIYFKKDINFKNIKFRYSEKGPWVLDGLNFKIKKGSRIGIVGTTGSGKSTTVDILMGLLPVSSGALSIDGTTITRRNVNSWQKYIAHVPQNIFLSDSSLIENIAFGVDKNIIDINKAENCIKKAQLNDLVSSLEKGYYSVVGERGSRLSGGQRQRIGIARALYKDAQVLILDEATSSLDNLTEKSVMDSISLLGNELTIIIIAHRFSTVKGCDVIFELENGKIKASGSYAYLLKHSPSFKKMAFVNEKNSD